jgi:multidrug resistance efflux pump
MERSRAHDRRASLEVRCADLERAIANARVTAPIDGVVARIDVVPGDSVREGDVVAAVASQNAKLIGSIQLPEARRAQIVAGTGVRLAFDAFPPERYGTAHGRIVRLDYAGDSASKAAGGDWAKETETIVAEVEIDTLPPAIAKAEVGMAFTGYVQTEKTGLLTLLLPSPGR